MRTRKTCPFELSNGRRCRNKACLRYGGYCHHHAWAGTKLMARAVKKIGFDVMTAVAAEEIIRHAPSIIRHFTGSAKPVHGKPAKVRPIEVSRSRPQLVRRRVVNATSRRR
jgi:hypothetical protein